MGKPLGLDYTVNDSLRAEMEIDMAEKQILFNTEMVRAILDGRKTQTRRLVKNIPLQEPYFEVVDGTPYACDGDGEWHSAVEFSPIQEGDVLYVRETWCNVNTKEYPSYFYKADNNRPSDFNLTPWRPSIHMPKEAARLFLRVTGVRCERLQEITSREAVAEGIQSNLRSPSEAADALIAFEALWNSTVRQGAMKCWGWNANPWVWVIEFERIKRGRAGEWADRNTAQYADMDVLA